MLMTHHFEHPAVFPFPSLRKYIKSRNPFPPLPSSSHTALSQETTMATTAATSATKAAVYTHGHHASVLRSHTWRTALNSASYLLPHLHSTHTLLDIGCGPGTITTDLASYVSHVTAIDISASVIQQASERAQELGVRNVVFEEGDVFALTYPDASFDVVHAHQVLQHVRDPVAALRELRRVTKPGGVVAVREVDFAGTVWYPLDSAHQDLTTWLALYSRVARSNGGEPDAGRRLHAWARDAGFESDKIVKSSSTWCYASREEVAWWSGLWAERTVKSDFASSALRNGVCTKEELEQVAESWKAWGNSQDAWCSLLHGEVLCRV
ncbi:S-adenosyl-L-methionine-dependent methyltransferase [Powellomyces hirtus]|nr:S-adenosyl-L-methionine-dependent methyltransferase [Powellomyces hirtus]